jgi:gamma-glutamylcyclotransferase (GGCT)/AIG2-like uncharacterized protein YtfP/predicted RNA-binding Zn-ribbon protein involved in translation (DUF1610 family)
MHRRCGAVDVEGIAILPGYRLAFAGWSMRWGGAVATIVPARRCKVPGVLYRVGTRALEMLDRFEGYPWIYERTMVRVFDGSKRWRRAQAYALDAVVEGRPATTYLEVIERAYRAWGFDQITRFKTGLTTAARRRRSAASCPRCGARYVEPPALSRLDNETEICPPCGTDEALVDHGAVDTPLRPLTPDWLRRLRRPAGR